MFAVQERRECFNFDEFRAGWQVSIKRIFFRKQKFKAKQTENFTTSRNKTIILLCNMDKFISMLTIFFDNPGCYTGFDRCYKRKYIFVYSSNISCCLCSDMPCSVFRCLWCCLNCNFVQFDVNGMEQFYLQSPNNVSLLFWISNLSTRLKARNNDVTDWEMQESQSQLPVPSQVDALTWQTCICILKRSRWCLVSLANTCQGNRKEGKLISWR